MVAHNKFNNLELLKLLFQLQKQENMFQLCSIFMVSMFSLGTGNSLIWLLFQAMVDKETQIPLVTFWEINVSLLLQMDMKEAGMKKIFLCLYNTSLIAY